MRYAIKAKQSSTRTQTVYVTAYDPETAKQRALDKLDDEFWEDEQTEEDIVSVEEIRD